MSELSRRRIRSVNKLLRIGKDEFVLVIRADQEKGYIDLSKRRATPEDHEAAKNRYEKAKAVHSIVCFSYKQLKNGAEGSQEELESLMRRAVWHFDRKYKTENERHKASYTWFKKAVDDPTVFDECDLTQEEKTELLRNIMNKMTPTPDKIRADIDVQCLGPDGIDAIKSALRHGVEVAKQDALDSGLLRQSNLDIQEAKSDADKKKDGPVLNQISISLITSPAYVVNLHTLDKEKGLENVRLCIKSIQDKITSYEHGKYTCKDEPRIVGVEDDVSLQREMDEAAARNREVPDDDEEDAE